MRRGRSAAIALFLIVSLLMFPMTALSAVSLAAPANVKATAASPSQINLTWEPVNSATEYHIYRANQLGGTYTYIGTSRSTSYSSTGLTPQTVYYYRVQALNNAGASDYSAEIWTVTFTGTASSGNTAAGLMERVSGNDRYQTAIEIAKAGWRTSDYAIIASGENFPDALCASPLTQKYQAPILLTSKNVLPTETQKQLLEMKVKNAILIGGTGVISEKVAGAIKELGISVSRLAGDDRYGTSLAIAKEIGKFDKAIIASGLNYQDVISIAPIAAKEGMPILLTPKDRIANELKTMINNYAEETYVLGDADIISNQVFNQLVNPKRLTGSDWYKLNINIIETFKDTLDLSTCYLATGAAYPDALAGSVFASLSSSPVILVKNPLDKTTQGFFEKYSNEINQVVAFGGTSVITESLLNVIEEKVEAGNGGNLLVTDLAAAPQSASQINLSWKQVNDANVYHVYRSLSYNGAYEKITTTVVPYYNDNYLSGGTTYYYKIQAVGNSKAGDYSNVAYATTSAASGDLTQPSGVKATVVNGNQINLSWNTVNNALYYNVHRSTIIDGPYLNVASVATPYYSDNNLDLGSTYYYKIQALNNTYASPYSDIVQAQGSSGGTQLTAPTNVSATGLSATQVYLNWDAVHNATFYNVYRSTSLNGPDNLVASVNSPSHLDASLSSGITYFYKIQSGNAKGVGGFSTVVVVTTQQNTSNLGTPSNIKVTPLNSTQMNITWEPVPNATYYTVYRGTTLNGSYDIIGSVNTLFFTDSNCTAKTTYYYKIQAGNNYITGIQSGPVVGTTN
ncbi:putative cell wall-binding protein [Desulfitobacterium sp. LBE]|uniref:cell wall-binding repeat-containing protein n=1 Tax=Desulfitobacterium sp. LBE TaxID=884086 RepID=UPI00119A6CA5|nr:cell wall-binding repeat-containing protein [Desulfitobacterium sp. LBE]TWH59713.1 putative cell wall-binding protein [Desulfitobacterium sp. LBE]